MLPLATQARKAIWTAVNPHTGKRRIDEAFPHEIRRRTREQEMHIELVNGGTWAVLGSDNYQGSIGSSPAGIVYSEWAQSDPSSRGYLRPILTENKGWQLYITTPRGHNHAERTFQAALRDPGAYAEIATAEQTGVFTAEQLADELKAYVDDYGEDFGTALYAQEYLCSFNAAIVGSIYGEWISKAERDGRVGEVQCESGVPVSTAWDLGYGDTTPIWFWQMVRNEVRLIDYYANSGKDVKHYCDVLKDRGYDYGKHYVPHDAVRKVLEAGGRSVVQQAHDEGIKMTVVPATIQMNQIAAARATLKHSWFDAEKCSEGLDALRFYHFEYDEDRKCFRDTPVHDWSSHGCDAYEVIAQVWREQTKGKDQDDGQEMRVVTPSMWKQLDKERRGRSRAT
jgi:hypothetical protein